MLKAPRTVREVELTTIIEKCVRDKDALKNNGHGLAYLCLKLLRRAEDSLIFESITDGGNDLGVDFLYIDESEEKPTAVAISTRWFTKEHKQNQPFPHYETDKVLRFFNHLKSEEVDLDVTCNERLKERIIHLKQILSKQVVSIEYWNVSNSEVPQPTQMQALVSELGLLGISVREMHRDQIVSLMVSDSVTGPRRILKVDPSSSVAVKHSNAEGILGVVSAIELCGLLESPLFPGVPDPSLFAKNVRSFLGLGGEVNKEIVKSLRRNQADHFWAKNNGLTMVARDWDARNLKLSGLIEVRGLSILNGAQTCSALFEKYKNSHNRKDNLGDVFVVFKLIKSNDDEFIYNLTLTTNTQNRIRPRDIMANHEYQINLESELAKVGIRYRRRSGELDLDDGLPSLSSTLAGQLLLSSYYSQPHRAKSETETIFGSLHDQLFRNPDTELLIRSFNRYRLAQNIGEQIKAGLIKLETDVNTSFVSYAMFHVVAVAESLDRLGGGSDDEIIVVSAFNHIAKHLNLRRTSFYEYFRSPKRSDELLTKFEQFDLFEVL